MCVQAMSPDGEAIVTGAGDETLRFWNVFSKTRSTKVQSVSFVYCIPLYIKEHVVDSLNAKGSLFTTIYRFN